MRIYTVQQDCDNEEAVEVCFGCGGNIKEGNLAWFLDDDGDSYLPCHNDGDCADEDRMISHDEYVALRDETLAPLIEEDCSCDFGCMGVRECSICGPHDEDANVGYDIDGRPIGG